MNHKKELLRGLWVNPPDKERLAEPPELSHRALNPQRLPGQAPSFQARLRTEGFWFRGLQV